MSDVYAGVRNFYLTNGKPGDLANPDTPTNDRGHRIAIGRMELDVLYGVSVSGLMGNGLALIDRAELTAIRDAITLELDRGSN